MHSRLQLPSFTEQKGLVASAGTRHRRPTAHLPEPCARENKRPPNLAPSASLAGPCSPGPKRFLLRTLLCGTECGPVALNARAHRW